MIYRIVCCSGDGAGIDIYGPDAEMAVLNPHLEIELNSAGSLEFTLPVENENWNVPNVFQNEIEVWEDDKIIWFGRPLQIVRDWNNQRRVVCEGALSYFNDTIQRTWEQQPATNKTNISFFKHLINIHNNDTQNNKHFTYSDSTITIESIPAYRKTDYDTTLDCLQNMCLATDGGFFILRKEYTYDPTEMKDVATRYIDWYETLPENAMQDVQFGVNLLDISQDLNGADICTVLIVSGKDDVMLNELGNKNPASNNGVGHNSGSDEIYYQPGVETYGRIIQQKSWNDYSDINELWRKAKEWMIEKNTDIPTIECSAADLYYISDPDMVVDGPLQVGMKVNVVSAPHDFNKQLLMYKISMDLDSGVKKVTLGTPPKKELTDIVAPSSGGSSTTSGKGAAGGSSESGSGSGGGSQTVIAPVQDVKVKMPGDSNFSSVVKKKVAKLDLSDLGKVQDVTVDGTSVLNTETHVAEIEIPVKDVVNKDGTSVVDSTGKAILPVTGVEVDNQSVVDEHGVAKIEQAVRDVQIEGTSMVDPQSHIANLKRKDVSSNRPIVETVLEIDGFPGDDNYHTYVIDDPGDIIVIVTDFNTDAVHQSTFILYKPDSAELYEEDHYDYASDGFIHSFIKVYKNVDAGSKFSYSTIGTTIDEDAMLHIAVIRVLNASVVLDFNVPHGNIICYNDPDTQHDIYLSSDERPNDTGEIFVVTSFITGDSSPDYQAYPEPELCGVCVTDRNPIVYEDRSISGGETNLYESETEDQLRHTYLFVDNGTYDKSPLWLPSVPDIPAIKTYSRVRLKSGTHVYTPTNYHDRYTSIVSLRLTTDIFNHVDKMITETIKEMDVITDVTLNGYSAVVDHIAKLLITPNVLSPSNPTMLKNLRIGNETAPNQYLDYYIPSVVANQASSPSDPDLTTLSINDTTYKIPSGGGGGGITLDVLYSRSSYPSSSGSSGQVRTYAMANSLDNYDAVYVQGWMYWNKSSGYEAMCGMLIFKSEFYISPSTQSNQPWSFVLNGSYDGGTRLLYFRFTSSTALKTMTEATEGGNEPILYKVYGIKF